MSKRWYAIGALLLAIPMTPIALAMAKGTLTVMSAVS